VVEWNVENESGMQQYEIERASDGSTFLKTGIVAALNKGAGSYSWTDSNPFEGNNYYRIKSVSKDGGINYTKIVKVVMDKIATEISVYPNPVKDGTIHVQMQNQQAGVYAIKLTNSLGQVLIASKVTHFESNSFETISVGKLPKGIYQLKVVRPDGDAEMIRVLN
jgi:hypothetical protein